MAFQSSTSRKKQLGAVLVDTLFIRLQNDIAHTGLEKAGSITTQDYWRTISKVKVRQIAEAGFHSCTNYEHCKIMQYS